MCIALAGVLELAVGIAVMVWDDAYLTGALRIISAVVLLAGFILVMNKVEIEDSPQKAVVVGGFVLMILGLGIPYTIPAIVVWALGILAFIGGLSKDLSTVFREAD